MYQHAPEKAMQHDDYRTEMPEDWKEGYRAAMNDAASVARELYVNHMHHTGTEGLLKRCQEAEQVFVGDAEKMHAC
jgi:hypothetical protein